MIDGPERLRAVPALAGCTASQLATIASCAEEARIPAGHALVAESQFPRHAYLIIEGEASVLVDGGAVALVGPGALVGDVSTVDRQRRVTTVRTTTPVTVVVIDPRTLIGVLGPPAANHGRVEDEILAASSSSRRTDT